MKALLKKIHKFFLIFGLDVSVVIFLPYLITYYRDRKKFIKMGGVIDKNYPIIKDFKDTQAGSFNSHYFHQDLLVASLIFKNNPQKHIDIGSRIDGFVAHVASFRSIEVMDIRDTNIIGHANIISRKINVMEEIDLKYHNITDSLSCLNAIEHIGLGRYKDPIEPNGHVKGFNNLIKILKPTGYLYISFPIGVRNAVHFNAHRIFAPKDIFLWAENKKCLKLERFDFVDDQAMLHLDIDLQNSNIKTDFGCGIYTFKKLK